MPEPGSNDPTIPPSQVPTASVPTAAPPPRPALSHLAPGTVVSRYRVESVLGEGGMGTVYLARQERPDRQVALKVVRPGYATERMLRRFEMEAEVLGRLLHPGIAQIYEAGVFHADDESASRRALPIPFFAMELVKGVPLTHYAHEKKLTTRERLELVAKVCDAVQHAHQKGVIHRDLKPGNILVVDEVAEWQSGEVAKREDKTPGPARIGHHSATLPLRHSATSSVGQPKILDFGVARATDSDIQQTTVQTDAGAIIGTIPYMSPEQVGGDPAELDTRSDVYALGVIAYELLVSRLPYSLERKMLHEAARVIREEEPTRLSSIDRALRGDVETIVAHALEKDKARRYGAASALAADIRRHLADEPIAARPASTWYQLAKFSRRNKGLVAGVAIAFALSSAGLVLALVSRAKAIEARVTADRVADFMSATLAGAGPEVALGRDTMMLRKMMDAGADRIRRGELSDAVEAELRLRATIGSTYSDLAVFDAALDMLEPGTRVAVARFGPNSLEAADLRLRLALALHTLGDLERAEVLMRQSLRTLRQLCDGDHEHLARALTDLAILLRERTRLVEAESLAREAMAMWGRLSPSDYSASATHCLGLVLYDRGELAEAESLLRKSLEFERSRHGEIHPSVVICLSDLSAVVWAAGRLNEAQSLSKQALETQRRLVHGNHPVLAASTENLGIVLSGLGDLSNAEALFRESLAMKRQLFHGDHAGVARTLANLASVRCEQGELAEGESLFRESLDMNRRLLPTDNLTVANSIYNLARAVHAQGKQECEPLYREAIEMTARVQPEGSPIAASALVNLASISAARGDLAVARGQFERSVQMFEGSLGADHADTTAARIGLGSVLAELNQLAQSEAVLQRALSSFPESREGARELRDRCAGALITLYEKWDEVEPGKGYFTKAAEWRAKLDALAPPAESRNTATSPEPK